MSLLSPLSLVLFIPLGAAIIVLYLLKLKRKERTVSSVLLWQDAVADIQANAPFQKLKKSLLLLLQLLALLLLILAAARPFVKAKGIAENRIVIILDSSASMQSTDLSPSRFEAAKSRAIEIVRRMGPGDTMLVITADAKTRVVSSFTSDKKALSSAISRLKPTDTGCNIRQAITLALSLVAGKSSAPPRVVVLSDGGFSALTDLAVGKAKLDFVRIGKKCDNVAITGLDSRRTPSGDQQVFIGLRNFSGRTRTCNLEISLDDRLIDIREETLRAGQTRQEIIENTGDMGGRITAKLGITDDLAADDTGWVYLAKRRKINVLMVSAGNIFLQNALNLDPRTQLVRTDSLPADFDKQKYDLVVFDGKAPPDSLPPGGYLLLNCAADEGPANLGSTVNQPAIVEWAQNHPLTAYVDFSSIRIAKAKRLKPKPWATPIVEADSGTLAAAGVQSGCRFVQLSFSILDSDFPLKVGFPIFITNCLDWLAPIGAESGDSIRTGSPMYIDVPPGTTSLMVTNPEGRKKTINVVQTPVVYDDTSLVGVYRISGKGLKREIACNLASPQESATAPKDAVMVGGRKFSVSRKAVQTNRELYGPLVLIALAVLSFEWFAYHRRL